MQLLTVVHFFDSVVLVDGCHAHKDIFTFEIEALKLDRYANSFVILWLDSCCFLCDMLASVTSSSRRRDCEVKGADRPLPNKTRPTSFIRRRAPHLNLQLLDHISAYISALHKRRVAPPGMATSHAMVVAETRKFKFQSSSPYGWYSPKKVFAAYYSHPDALLMTLWLCSPSRLKTRIPHLSKLLFWEALDEPLSPPCTFLQSSTTSLNSTWTD